MVHLVVGGAGYIGSHLVKKLCDSNENVIVFDNLSSGFKENVDSRAEFVKGDLLNKEDFDQIDGKIDSVFHFAALKAAGESMEQPEKYSENNITGGINLFNFAISKGVKNFVFSSSAAVYGYPKTTPLDEKHDTNPINYYGYTKLTIENILKWYSKLKGINFAALRYFNATGYDVEGKLRGKEINPLNLLPIIMEVASGQREKLFVFGDDYDTSDGTCIRDYIHVDDLSNAHIKALDYIKNNKNLIVNLGTERGYSVLDIIKLASLVVGKDLSYEVVSRRVGDPSELIASSQLALKNLGWKAKQDMNSILKTTWDVYN
ncbi:UDP-glucose 4-epimerase GalE [archaeon]|nr:UDP-glucose 4-epimerase GalE [archaeon]